jgi:glycosyltransferase involved in cell wall biosynthesis
MIDKVKVVRIRTSCFGRARLAFRAIDYLTFYLGAVWHLFRLVRAGDWVVAKTDPPLVSVLAMAVTAVRGAVLVNWIQDLFPEVAESFGLYRNRLLIRLLRGLRNVSLHRALWNVVPGHRMARRLIDLGVERDRVRVVHNWADGERIRPIERSRNELVDRWDLRDKFVVGYSGNMGRVHEFGTIIDAATLLNGSGSIAFLFIGDGARRDWLVREAERRSLKNVVFKPYQPKDLLSLSLGVPHVHLISLCPSQEGLIVPSKFYGIAAAGRPTIFVGDPAGEIPRILEEERCGWAVAVGSSLKLADRIAQLAGNPSLADEAGERARKAFERRFDMRRAWGQWESLLFGREVALTSK